MFMRCDESTHFDERAALDTDFERRSKWMDRRIRYGPEHPAQALITPSNITRLRHVKFLSIQSWSDVSPLRQIDDSARSNNYGFNSFGPTIDQDP